MQERRMERVISSDIFSGRDLRRLPGTDHSSGRGKLAGRLLCEPVSGLGADALGDAVCGTPAGAGGIGGGDDPRRIPAAAGAGIPAFVIFRGLLLLPLFYYFCRWVYTMQAPGLSAGQTGTH